MWSHTGLVGLQELLQSIIRPSVYLSQLRLFMLCVVEWPLEIHGGGFQFRLITFGNQIFLDSASVGKNEHVRMR